MRHLDWTRSAKTKKSLKLSSLLLKKCQLHLWTNCLLFDTGRFEDNVTPFIELCTRNVLVLINFTGLEACLECPNPLTAMVHIMTKLIAWVLFFLFLMPTNWTKAFFIQCNKIPVRTYPCWLICLLVNFKFGDDRVRWLHKMRKWSLPGMLTCTF